MFLLVGEILGIDNIHSGNLTDSSIINNFWKLMQEKKYVYINDLEGFYDLVKSSIISEIKYIISRGAHFRYTEEFLRKFPNLEKIFLFQIGNDNVDLQYCKQRGIEVVNFVSKKSIYSVAELTISGLIMGIRQALTLGCKLKGGLYTRNPIGKNLDDLTIGVMGCGRIGQKVIDLLQILPVKIITYDVIFGFNEKEEWLLNLEKNLKNKGIDITDNLDYFLKQADYITIHIPGFDENLGLLDYFKLKNIRGIVNMSRAGIVVEKDLIKLLDEEKLEFYISDVVEGEPYIDKINKKLINHEKVFITPHIGANTVQVQEDIMKQFLEFISRNV